MSLKIAVMHSKVKIGAKRGNLRRLGLELGNIMDNWSDIDLVVLPAYPITGPLIGYYPPNRAKQAMKNMAERISSKGTALGQSIVTISKWSEDYGINIIAGPILERAGPKLYSTVLHIAPDGSIEGKYRKITLTRKEVEAGLSPGRSVEVFNIRGKGLVGVYVDEDLTHPEIFRVMQTRGSNIIIGFMLPYESDYFRMTNYHDGRILTMELDPVIEFLSVRSRETGLPVILVGGGVEGVGHNNHNNVAFMPTIPSDPDVGVAKNRILDYDRLDSDPMIIELDTRYSRPRSINAIVAKSIVKELCMNRG